MRVAICLSGQPRMWRKSVPFWEEMFASHGSIDFDVFFHFWNFNTISGFHNDILTSPPAPRPLPQAELDEIVHTLQPCRHAFSGVEVDAAALLMEMTRRRNHPWPYCNDLSDPLIYRHSPQFYSFMRVAHLKRSYEIEHDFEYDVCVRARPDIAFPTANGLNRLSDMPIPKSNTVYGIHMAYEERFKEYRLGDLFFYSDSLTFDRMSLFFKSLSMMKESMFGCGVYPEIALMLHAKCLNIEAEPLTGIAPKVRRDAAEFVGRELGPLDIL